MKFTWDVLNLSAQQVAIATAVAQSWAQCGIVANIAPIAPNLYNGDIIGGSYQAGFNPSGSAQDPRIATTYISSTGTFEVGNHGFQDPVIQADLEKSLTTNNQDELTKLWHTIWSDMNTDAVDIPVINGPSYLVYNKCIHNVEENYGTLGNFMHAYLTCPLSA